MNQDYHYNGRYTSSTRDRSQGKLLGSPLPFALALIIGGAVIFGLWYYFYAGSHPQLSNQPTPVIKADAGPIKVKPDSNAQPEVPHQDKLVYSRVNPSEQGKGVERLLPPTEEPVDLPVTEKQGTVAPEDGFPNPSVKSEDKSQFRSEPMASSSEVKEPKQVTDAQDAKAAPKAVDPLPGSLVRDEGESVIKEQPAAHESLAAQQPSTELQAVAPTAANTKALQSGYRIQLASMKSQELATGEWTRLQGEYKGILSALTPTYTRVDLGAKKGIFYRVQAGDFASKAEAQDVCTRLKAQNPNAGCILVKF